MTVKELEKMLERSCYLFLGNAPELDLDIRQWLDARVAVGIKGRNARKAKALAKLDADDKEALGLSWSPLGRDVWFGGYEIAGGARLLNGKVEIVFDANGFTADQTIFLRHRSDERTLWSIQIRGLMGNATIVRDFDGSYYPLPTVDEAAF